MIQSQIEKDSVKIAQMQELKSNYNLLCDKYKQLKKESMEKDKIILNQDKEINKLNEKVKMYAEKFDL